MKTIRTIISDIRTILKENNRDSVLTNKAIWNRVCSVNTQLSSRLKLWELYNIGNFTSVSLETEEYDIFKDSCVPLECVKCRVKLPDISYTNYGLVYNFFGSPDFSKKFKIYSPSLYSTKIGKRSSEIPAYRENGYVYMSECIPCPKLVYLDTTGLSLDEDKCSFLDNVAPIPDKIYEDVIGLSLEKWGIFLQKKADRTIDKND